jgi:hypothetical protein
MFVGVPVGKKKPNLPGVQLKPDTVSEIAGISGYAVDLEVELLTCAMALTLPDFM